VGQITPQTSVTSGQFIKVCCVKHIQSQAFSSFGGSDSHLKLIPDYGAASSPNANCICGQLASNGLLITPRKISPGGARIARGELGAWDRRSLAEKLLKPTYWVMGHPSKRESL